MSGAIRMLSQNEEAVLAHCLTVMDAIDEGRADQRHFDVAEHYLISLHTPGTAETWLTMEEVIGD